jgi:hypothetical protein
VTVDNTQFPATVDSQTSLPKKRQVRTPQGPKTVPVALVEPATNEPAPKSRRASGESSPLIPLLLIGIGGYLAWFGVKYWRGTGPAVWPSYPIKSVLQGKGIPPNTPAESNATQVTAYETAAAGGIAASEGGVPGPVGGGGQGSQAIASDALKYKGAGYVYGGAPGSGAGNWDCSSFANAVIGRDLKMAIPGYKAGAYDGSQHGPAVDDWLLTSLCETVVSPAAGDIVCWQGAGPAGHMGIAISATQLISALDPAQGTNITLIGTTHPGVPVARRVIAATASPGGGPSPGASETLIIRAILGAMGAPQNQPNINSMASWISHETPWPPVARFNPMNTTESAPGATDYNSVGVKNYTSWGQGIAATVATLTGGYPGIVAGFRSGQGVCGPGHAAEFLKWSGGGYASIC